MSSSSYSCNLEKVEVPLSYMTPVHLCGMCIYILAGKSQTTTWAAASLAIGTLKQIMKKQWGWINQNVKTTRSAAKYTTSR